MSTEDRARFFDADRLSRLQTILDRVCNDLKIDQTDTATKPTREFLGRLLIGMTDREVEMGEALVQRLAARGRAFGFSRGRASRHVEN